MPRVDPDEGWRTGAAVEVFAPLVTELARKVAPKLLAEDAMLGQIQREFCEAAPAACAAAVMAFMSCMAPVR